MSEKLMIATIADTKITLADIRGQLRYSISLRKTAISKTFFLSVEFAEEQGI